MITPAKPRALPLLPTPNIRAKARIWVGLALLVLGFGLSIPAAISNEWQKVLAYLVITAAGLCLIFTGAVRRGVLSGQANHVEQMSAMTTVLQEIANIRVLADRVDSQDGRILNLETTVSDVVQFLTQRYGYATGLVDGAVQQEQPGNGSVLRFPQRPIAKKVGD